MACYRNGGCGPYEMYSCSECPASKPEYAHYVTFKTLSEEQGKMLDDMIDELVAYGRRLEYDFERADLVSANRMVDRFLHSVGYTRKAKW